MHAVAIQSISTCSIASFLVPTTPFFSEKKRQQSPQMEHPVRDAPTDRLEQSLVRLPRRQRGSKIGGLGNEPSPNALVFAAGYSKRRGVVSAKRMPVSKAIRAASEFTCNRSRFCVRDRRFFRCAERVVPRRIRWPARRGSGRPRGGRQSGLRAGRAH